MEAAVAAVRKLETTSFSGMCLTADVNTIKDMKKDKHFGNACNEFSNATEPALVDVERWLQACRNSSAAVPPAADTTGAA